MKENKNIYFSVLTLFVMSFQSDAFVIRNGVWRLSEIVTNNTLYSKLFDIEDEAGKGNFERVETLIRDIRNSGAFTNYYTNEGEPLLLTLDSASLWYRCEAA